MTAINEKITIQGTPPKWNQEEYETRVESWVLAYRGTEASMQMLRAPFEHELIQMIIDKSKQGFTVAKNKLFYHGNLDHTAWMIKPESQQAEDIAAIKLKIKKEYAEFLQSERVKYEDMLRQQLIQAQEEKDRRAAEQAKAKLMAAIEKQVSDCFAPLVIPD